MPPDLKVRLLLTLFWVCYFGSLVDIAIVGVATYAAARHDNWLIDVDTLLRNHLAWLYWVRQLAMQLLPDGIADRIFALPALMLFPLRVLVNNFIGMWALQAVGRLRRHATLVRYGT